jgi:putative ABC transport system permease protein
MQLKDTFTIAFRGITANPLRAFLTTLGIVIGIASVILMLSLGQGAQGLILAQVSSFGPDSVFVAPGGGEAGPPKLGSATVLKYRDAVALEKLPSLVAVAPMLLIDARVSYGSVNKNPNIIATTPQVEEVNALEVKRGTFFSREDFEAARTIAVLGSSIATDLFGDQDPIGKTIFIKRKSFTVSGVLVSQGTKFFQNFDDRIYVPLTAARSQLSGVDYVNFIAAKAAAGGVDRATEELTTTLRELHKIDNPTGDVNLDDFHIETAQQAADILTTISGALTLFLAAIASISLIVGGIGIMNIMLVSVTERTREIGLRKAVGATRGDILGQFLIEAILLTFFGGAVGVFGGTGMSFLLSLVISQFQRDWVFVIPLYAVVLSFGVAVVVGLGFGLYPARKAAALNPIEALRYE